MPAPRVRTTPLLVFRPEQLNHALLLCQLSVPPPPDPGCKGDVDCPSKLACFNGDCRNPCVEIKPCAPNADCRVYDTLPRRTMTCTCREGFSGKGDVRCEKISKAVSFSFCLRPLCTNSFLNSAAPLELGCSSDDECPDSQACENRLCVNPCLVENPCSPLATCRPRNHRAQCYCPPGMTGDGYRSCTPSMSPFRLFC